MGPLDAPSLGDSTNQRASGQEPTNSASGATVMAQAASDVDPLELPRLRDLVAWGASSAVDPSVSPRLGDLAN